MTDSAPNQPIPIKWVFWFQWILTTTLGWLVGWAVLGEVGIGAAIGLAQWLVLRREVSNAGWWILASTVAWLVGWEIVVAGLVVPPGVDIISSLITGAVVGLLMGVAQWLVLRQWTQYASLWILANVSVWSVSFTGIIGGALFTGVMIGAITGLVLDFLLRYPLNEKEIS